MNRHFYLALLICSWLCSLKGTAQAAGDHQGFDTSWSSYLYGEWKGAGAFGNGKKIAATVRFSYSLDRAWLKQTYHDLPPNRYAAEALWSLDTAVRPALVHTFDNFGGYRAFEAGEGDSNRLVLSYKDPDNLVWQRFVYEKLSAHQFRLTYETSRDQRTWKLGDWLLFERQ